MTILSRWKTYRRKSLTQCRPHLVGEEMKDISVSKEDKEAVKHPGGMIGRNAYNPLDQWYIAKEYFIANYDEEEVC